MIDRDIVLKTSNGRFSYRVGAIIIDSGNILLTKNSGEPYYYTVGGRVRLGESAREAVLREAFEETQVRFEIERLSFIHENFFTWEDGNEPFHEVAFFFLLKNSNQAANLKINTFSEEYGEVSLNWLPINDLEKLLIYPEFFKTEINRLSDDTKHFISRNGVTLRYD